jgi:hypothetical protein
MGPPEHHRADLDPTAAQTCVGGHASHPVRTERLGQPENRVS